MTPGQALTVALLAAAIIVLATQLVRWLLGQYRTDFDMYDVTRKFGGSSIQRHELKREVLVSPGEHIIRIMVIPRSLSTLRTINVRLLYVLGRASGIHRTT